MKTKLPEDFQLTQYGLSARLVRESDAPFILSLRSDPSLSQFLSPTSPRLSDQKAWISAYRERERAGEDYYFLISDAKTAAPNGVIRLYHFQSDRFEYGSWLFLPHLGTASIRADLLVRTLAFEKFGYELCTFEVRKGNKSVITYHKSIFSSEVVGEDELNYYFILTKSNFLAGRTKLERSFSLT